MSSESTRHDRDHAEVVVLHALRALPADEVAAADAQIAACADCRHELERLRPIVGTFAAWPTDVLRPSTPLWERLAERIGDGTSRPAVAPAPEAPTADWFEAAPGISCKLLATDTENGLVSMLVRLAPGTDYPGHRHGALEQLHLLDGVLHVDARTYQPGDYLSSEPGTVDHRVWSETGCTCFLLTSYRDVLF
jgi:quercetin dioxygenase-like cupin family protein